MQFSEGVCDKFISVVLARKFELIGDNYYVYLDTISVIFCRERIFSTTQTLTCIVFDTFRCSQRAIQTVVKRAWTTLHSLLGLCAKAAFNIRDDRQQARVIAFALPLTSGDIKPNPGQALGLPKQQST